MRANSILLTASSARSASSAASTAVASSLASSASSISTPASSSRLALRLEAVDRRLEPRLLAQHAPAPCRRRSRSPRRRSARPARLSAVFLPSMSKMPPENLQSALQLRQAFSQGPDFHGGGGAEDSTNCATCARLRSKTRACTKSSGRTRPEATSWRSPCSRGHASRSRWNDCATKPRSKREIESRSSGFSLSCRRRGGTSGWAISGCCIELSRDPQSRYFGLFSRVRSPPTKHWPGP